MRRPRPSSPHWALCSSPPAEGAAAACPATNSPPDFGEVTMGLLDMFSKKPAMPDRADALPGRPDPIATAEKHFVNGRALKGPYPDGAETALFGLGCFWGAERVFWKTPGVHVTAVGYAAGATPNPTYKEVCSG